MVCQIPTTSPKGMGIKLFKIMKFVVIQSYPELEPKSGNPTVNTFVDVHDSFGDIAGYLGEGEFVETDFDDEIRFRRTDGAQIVIKAIDTVESSRIQNPSMP